MKDVVQFSIRWSHGYFLDDLFIKCQSNEFRHGLVELLVDVLHLVEIAVVVTLASSHSASFVVKRDSWEDNEVETFAHMRESFVVHHKRG